MTSNHVLHFKAEHGHRTALHFAVSAGLPVLRLVLQHPSVDLGARDSEGNTALALAVEAVSVSVIEMILDHPAAVESVNHRIAGGHTALHLACLRGMDSLDPLHHLMKTSSLKSVCTLRCLLQHPTVGARLDVNAADVNGRTVLHIACTRGDAESARLILQHAGVDISISDAEGRTALHLACLGGHLDAVLCILPVAKAGDINAVDRQRRTPLILAASRKATSKIPSGSFRAIPGVRAASSSGGGSNSSNGGGGGTAIVRALLSYPGVAVNAADSSGYTALIMATREGHDDIISALRSHPEVQVNLADHRGNTAVHHACLNNKPLALKELYQFDEVNMLARNKAGEAGAGIANRLGHFGCLVVNMAPSGQAINAANVKKRSDEVKQGLLRQAQQRKENELKERGFEEYIDLDD